MPIYFGPAAQLTVVNSTIRTEQQRDSGSHLDALIYRMTCENPISLRLARVFNSKDTSREEKDRFLGRVVCKTANRCFANPMSQDLRERARWLARNLLPHEALIRAKLGGIRVYDLDIEDVIQEMYAHILSVPSLEAIHYPKQYALQTAKAIIIDHLRHSHVVSIISSGSLETLDVAVTESNCEERLEFQGEILAVAQALAQLPKMCRETLNLAPDRGAFAKGGGANA